MRTSHLAAALLVLTCSASLRAEEAPALPSPPNAPAEAGSYVEIQTQEPNVSLSQFSEGRDPPWRAVCLAPCGQAVDPSARYRIAGRGIMKSDPFEIPAGRRVRLNVDAGTRSNNTLGWVLLVGGGVAMGPGLSLLAA
ncbi:MAG: hypothetical protein KC766_38970 [Myxococcales bacterium]|nr:hypothetical protein [Myxococcales bacterium]